MNKKFDIGEYRKNFKINLGPIAKEVGDTVFKGGHNDLRKTNHKVQLNEEGKLDIYTHKTIVTESTKLDEGKNDYQLRGVGATITFKNGYIYANEDTLEIAYYEVIKLLKSFGMNNLKPKKVTFDF